MIMAYYVYILRLRDGSLYTGIAKDVEKRMSQHMKGKGSRYVRSRLPFSVVYTEESPTCSDAMKREAQIKRLPRSSKLFLIGARQEGPGSRSA